VTTPAKDPLETAAEPGRAFWREVLAAGGNTSLPRWTLDPVADVAQHEVPIPTGTAVAARRLADELAVPMRTMFLAAHAKVLAAVAGEREVITGYIADPVVRPLPCRLTMEPASWRDMVQRARRAESALRAYAGFALHDLLSELDLASPSFEAVFDPAGVADISGDTVLAVGFPVRDGRLVLQLRYRTEVLDAEIAARIAGYHLRALELIVANPDAEHEHRATASTPGRTRRAAGTASRPAPRRTPRRERHRSTRSP
jgi:hypothetical protein